MTLKPIIKPTRLLRSRLFGVYYATAWVHDSMRGGRWPINDYLSSMYTDMICCDCFTGKEIYIIRS